MIVAKSHRQAINSTRLSSVKEQEYIDEIRRLYEINKELAGTVELAEYRINRKNIEFKKW